MSHYGKPEKRCPRENGVYNQFLKKVARRLMRRLGKKYMDDAPKKLPTRGWSV